MCIPWYSMIFSLVSPWYRHRLVHVGPTRTLHIPLVVTFNGSTASFQGGVSGNMKWHVSSRLPRAPGSCVWKNVGGSIVMGQTWMVSIDGIVPSSSKCHCLHSNIGMWNIHWRIAMQKPIERSMCEWCKFTAVNRYTTCKRMASMHMFKV